VPDALLVLLDLAVGSMAMLAIARTFRGRIDAVNRPWRAGQAALAERRYADAETCFRESLAAAGRQFGPAHWRTALHVNALAMAICAQNRLDEAAELVDRAVRAIDAWGPRLPHPEVAMVLVGASVVAAARGDLEASRRLVDRARQQGRGNPSVRAAIERTLARRASAAGAHEDAADAMARVPVERLASKDVGLLVRLGLDRLRAGDAHRAVRCLTQALAVVERSTPCEFAVAFYRSLLGEALARAGRTAEARVALEAALSDYEAIAGERHPAVARVLVELASARLDAGDAAGCAAACERVLEMPCPPAAADPYRAGAGPGDPIDYERDRARTLLARARARSRCVPNSPT
jgi:tetratricopeptide (TPR) repeat protein